MPAVYWFQSGVNFLFVQHNVTGLCNRLKEKDFHTINGHARAFGFAVAVNNYELDKKRYPSSTQR